MQISSSDEGRSGGAQTRAKEGEGRYVQKLAIRKHYLYIAMGLETYGRLGPDFIAFLTSIAEIAAKPNEDLHSVPTMPSMRQQFIARQLCRYMRQISLVRVRGMANRIKSTVFEKQHHRTGQPVADECRTPTTSPPSLTSHPTRPFRASLGHQPHTFTLIDLIDFITFVYMRKFVQDPTRYCTRSRPGCLP